MVSFNRILRSVAIAASFVAVTNCSESATSPTSANSLTPSMNRHGGHGHASNFQAGATNSNYQLDGGSYIQFPGGSVCQLGVSGYGPGTWDANCDSAKNSTQINWQSSTNSGGHARYDFNPPMRFVPGHDVVLYIYDPIAANNPNSVIQYCNELNVCVDEGKNDPSLATGHNPATGYIFRRIKHFSGYSVQGGCSTDPNDPAYDPNCGNSSN